MEIKRQQTTIEFTEEEEKAITIFLGLKKAVYKKCNAECYDCPFHNCCSQCINSVSAFKDAIIPVLQE